VLNKIKNAAGAAASAVGSAVSGILGAGVDKLAHWVDEISAASPHLRAVGYRVGNLQLELSLTPRVIVELVKEADVHDEAFQAVLANHAGNKTLCTLVKMIQQARRVEAKIRLTGHRFAALEVELGLPPGMRMRYAEGPKPVAPADQAGQE
jgi:hypothetical protein